MEKDFPRGVEGPEEGEEYDRMNHLGGSGEDNGFGHCFIR